MYALCTFTINNMSVEKPTDFQQPYRLALLKYPTRTKFRCGVGGSIRWCVRIYVHQREVYNNNT